MGTTGGVTIALLRAGREVLDRDQVAKRVVTVDDLPAVRPCDARKPAQVILLEVDRVPAGVGDVAVAVIQVLARRRDLLHDLAGGVQVVGRAVGSRQGVGRAAEHGARRVVGAAGRHVVIRAAAARQYAVRRGQGVRHARVGHVGRGVPGEARLGVRLRGEGEADAPAVPARLRYSRVPSAKAL